jgi:hypothetical protein
MPLASATPILQVDGTGILTGVDGLSVDGTSYDVTFAKGSCASVYAACMGFTFTDFTTAQDATDAFANVISPSSYATNLTQIQGCVANANGSCEFLTPYQSFSFGISPNQTQMALVTVADFFNDGSVNTSLNGAVFASQIFSASTSVNYVLWTPSVQPSRCTSSDPNFFHDALPKMPAISGATIGTTFNYNAGINIPASCSLTDIAIAYGYNHFNWRQVVTNWPTCPGGVSVLLDSHRNMLQAPPVFNDPPPGGYLTQSADQPPYYYDEGANQSGPYALSGHEQGNMLTWSDAPYNLCQQFTDQQMSFTTSLVGVYDNETSSPPLATINWTSDAYCLFGCTGSASAQNTSGDEIFSGGITSAYLLDDPTDVPPDVLALLETQPTPIPEPGSLAIICGGLWGMLLMRLKRRQSYKL